MQKCHQLSNIRPLNDTLRSKSTTLKTNNLILLSLERCWRHRVCWGGEEIKFWKQSLLARLMGPAWGPPGPDGTLVGPVLAPWTLLSGVVKWTPILTTVIIHFEHFSTFEHILTHSVSIWVPMFLSIKMCLEECSLTLLENTEQEK